MSSSVRSVANVFALAIVATFAGTAIAAAKDAGANSCERICANAPSFACTQSCGDPQPQQARKRQQSTQPLATATWRDVAFGTGEGGSGGGGGGGRGK